MTVSKCPQGAVLVSRIGSMLQSLLSRKLPLSPTWADGSLLGGNTQTLGCQLTVASGSSRGSVVWCIQNVSP